MKIALVRGAHLNPWEMQSFRPLAERHDVRTIGADWQFYSPALPWPSMHEVKGHLVQWGGSTFSNSWRVPMQRLQSAVCGESYALSDLEALVKGYEILHPAEVYSTLSYECLRQKRRSGSKLVVTVWENLPGAGEKHPRRRQRKKEVIAEADAFLAVTDTTARLLRDEGCDPARIATIPMAIDLSHFKPSTKDSKVLSPTGFPADAFIVGFIGRLVEEKGLLDLLKSMAILFDQPRYGHVRFWVVGSGPLAPAVQQFQARYPQRVVWTPFLSYDQLPAVHNAFDLFALPSKARSNWQEQFGYVLIESMACGKPVLTTRSGSIPDVVGEAALLVEPGAVDGLTAALQSLIDSGDMREQLAQKAMSRASQQFSAQAVSDQIESLYKKVLA